MIFTRKAQFSPARKQIYFLVIGFVMTMILFGAFFMMNKFRNDLTKYPDELKGSLIYKRFVNNPTCLAYQETESKRVFTNTIDLSKFNEAQIQSCYNLNEEHDYDEYNFKMVLYNTQKSLKTNNYYNRTHYTGYYDVLIYDQGNITKDKLILYVQKEI